MKSPTQCSLALLVIAFPLVLTAASPSIGVIRSDGEFQVDGSTVRGNATLFEGTTVQTTGAQSRIALSGGPEMVLSPKSSVRLYRDRTVLQQGGESIRNAQRYLIEAAKLHISATDSHTVAEIVAQDGDRVSVAALKGSVVVRNEAGVLVATVRPGMPLAFDTQVADVAAAASIGTVPGAAGAAGAIGTAGAAAGVSTGLVVAVVAGVAVTGSVVGLHAVGIFSAAPPVSRP